MAETTPGDPPRRKGFPTWFKVLLPIDFVITVVILAVVLKWVGGRKAPPPVEGSGRPPETRAPGHAARGSRPATDWPAFHGGGTLAGVAPSGPRPPLHLVWTYRAAGAIEGSPVVAGGVVFVGDSGDTGGTLYAIDLAGGQKRWTYAAEHGFVTAPLVLNGRVFIGDDRGVFHAVDAATGARAWTLQTGAEIHSSANVVKGKVVFGSYDYFLYCVDPETGGVVWKAETDNYVHCTPAVDGDDVMIAGCDALLSVVDGVTGDVKETAELRYAAAASPVILKDRVVAATMSGKLICFDRADLTRQWTYTAADQGFFASPASSDGLVVIGGRDRQVYAVDLQTGDKAWAFATGGEVDSAPTIAGGRVYVGSSDGRLYVLDLETGTALWSFNAGRAIHSSPAVASGCVVFGDAGGHLYCLTETE